MSSVDDTDEWDFKELQSAPWDRPPWQTAFLQVEIAGLSHQGHVRQNNEDHFLTARYGRFLETLQSNIPISERAPQHELVGHALLVADGMGGAAAGEVASREAINILFHLVVDTPDWIFRLDEERLAAEIERRATKQIEHVGEVMTHEADVDPEMRGFGTTLVMAWGIGEYWFVAHVGDSRVYLHRDGTMQQLTNDHTVAQEMADAGLIKQQEVYLHRLRHRLTRVLGDQAEVTPEIRRLKLQENDCLLLCTDGLSEMINDQEIGQILASNQSADQCCVQLVDAALAAGGKDNVTAVVALFGAKICPKARH